MTTWQQHNPWQHWTKHSILPVLLLFLLLIVPKQWLYPQPLPWQETSIQMELVKAKETAPETTEAPLRETKPVTIPEPIPEEPIQEKPTIEEKKSPQTAAQAPPKSSEPPQEPIKEAKQASQQVTAAVQWRCSENDEFSHQNRCQRH